MPRANPKANVCSLEMLTTLSRVTEVLIVESNIGNEKSFTALNCSLYTNLKQFEVGDYSMAYVDELDLVGLSKLERVVIGKRSFSKDKNRDGYNPHRHFCLKDCPLIRELKMGCGSFSDYSICEIENVDRLEMIELGDLKEGSSSFCHANLELRSECGERE